MPRHKQKFDVEKTLMDFLLDRIGAKKRLLVAVSGGPDSMALLAAAKSIAKDLSCKIFAAHLLHHPNSGEARSRAQLVSAFCRKLRVKLFGGELPERDHGRGSPEERMRQERYRFLEEAAQKFSCDWILTAHHADDQAETVLMRVLAGTGLRGLIGIPEQRGLYLRPFRTLPKSSLLHYCQEQGVPFAEDPANLDLSFPRNRMRHEILPVLKQRVNPEVESALMRLGRWAQEADEVISAQVDRCWAASCRENTIKSGLFPKGKIVLDIDAILPYYKMIRKYIMLKAICISAGTEVALNAVDLDRAEALLYAKRTGTFLEFPHGVRLAKHGRELVVVQEGGAEPQYSLIPGRHKRLIKIGYRARWQQIRSGPFVNGAGLAADFTTGQSSGRLTLRPAKEGDRFHPLGAPGEKRLFRFLTDRKVSRLDKRHTWVLEEDGKIIWVIGHRISERARVIQPGARTWRLILEPLEGERNGP